jgi:glycosylphosphatidylinositol transamidase (GPIT) subunit GPI8
MRYILFTKKVLYNYYHTRREYGIYKIIKNNGNIYLLIGNY